MIRIKRVYDPYAETDGARYLVDALWPRGMKKDTLHMDDWLRDVAPSAALRKWFSHEPGRWDEFQRRYLEELKEKPDTWKKLVDAARYGPVTLLYAARDTEHNQAVVLRAFLEESLKE